MGIKALLPPFGCRGALGWPMAIHTAPYAVYTGEFGLI